MSLSSKRRRLSQHRTVDSPLGPLQLSHDSWPAVVVVVHGPGFPTVRILLGNDFGGGMSVDGQEVLVQTFSAWDPRRVARRRTAVVAGRGYELRPTGLRRARLLRDGEHIADGYGSLRAYSPFRNIPGSSARMAWRTGADAVDVAMGHAMVLAYGAGAPGALLYALWFCLDWIT